MSNGPSIRVEGLSKCYQLGPIQNAEPYQRFSDLVVKAARSVFRRPRAAANKEDFWALKDLTFTIEPGEVVGIIGRNGAGKSTLLKLLSRITEPTKGRITLRGRIASLLEVGTGFHPELTGRENIFLNGAILGMKRSEIATKFDEIIAFAEVERFLDTPVKRYSSGMYVRLAFAVAAHLEPEILVIDEVLAVGDAQFQQKCLGKMQQVAQGTGRTVLFVSHNLSSVARLCTRGIVLDRGALCFDGGTAEAIAHYAGIGPTQVAVVDLTKLRRPLATHNAVLFLAAKLLRAAGPENSWTVAYGEELEVELTVEANSEVTEIEPGLAIFSAKGFEVASWTSRVNGEHVKLKPGRQTLRFRWRGLRLVPGSYALGAGLRSKRGFEDYLPEIARFEIEITAESSQHGVDTFGGCVVPIVDCETVPIS